MVWKGQNNVRNYKFLAKYFHQYFQIFSNFYMQWKLADEILSIFQNLQTNGKEREKTFIQQLMRKEKLIKVRLCFITDCFIIPFKMIIIFFISQAHSLRNFCFLISRWCKKYEKEKLGMANCWKLQITIFISKLISSF